MTGKVPGMINYGRATFVYICDLKIPCDCGGKEELSIARGAFM